MPTKHSASCDIVLHFKLLSDCVLALKKPVQRIQARDHCNGYGKYCNDRGRSAGTRYLRLRGEVAMEISVGHAIMQNNNQNNNNNNNNRGGNASFQQRIVRRWIISHIMLNEYSPANIFGGWLDTRGGGFPGLDVNGGGFSNNIRTRRTLASDWPEIGPVIELVLGHIDIDHDALTWSRLRATSGELMDLVDNLTRIPIAYFAQQVRRWRRCRRNVPQDREYGRNVAYFREVFRMAGMQFMHGWLSRSEYGLERWHCTTPTVRYREVDYELNSPEDFEELEAALSYCRRWLLRRCMLEIAQDESLQDRQCP